MKKNAAKPIKKNAAMPIATPELLNEINKANETIDKIIDGRTPKELSDKERALIASLHKKVFKIRTDYDWNDRAYSEDGRCGIKDVFGNIVVPALFDDYFALYNYNYRSSLSAIPMRLNGKIVLVKNDGSGEVIPGTEYDLVEKTECGSFYRMWRGKKFGFMQLDGKIVLDCICDKCYEPCFDIIIFTTDGKWGVLYRDGTIIPPKFDEIRMPEFDDSDEIDFDEPLFVRLGDEWGYIDEQGNFTDDDREAYYCVWLLQ